MEKLPENQKDREFVDYYAERLVSFLKSIEKTIHLEPMNSFYRRLVHNLAKRFHFNTKSEGENLDRHIVITKTEGSRVPEDLNIKRPVWDWGDREFLVNPMEPEVEIVLLHNGSFGLRGENEKERSYDMRKITTGSFKIKNNKIVTIHDMEW